MVMSEDMINIFDSRSYFGHKDSKFGLIFYALNPP